MLMKESYRQIFDMDGTLYKFDRGEKTTFTTSQFYVDLRQNVYQFFMKLKGISLEQAIKEYERIKEQYNGEVSLGVEQEYGIDRFEYFDNTWNLNPEHYIQKDEDLSELFQPFEGNIALLTAAPKIWTINVLAYLDIIGVFGSAIYTGEPNLRKPDPLIFQKIADELDVPPERVISIGDQEYSDILPAKSIGMKAIYVGIDESTTADYQAQDIYEAVQILKEEGYI